MTDEGIYETKIEVVVYSRGPIDRKPPGYDNYGRTLLGDIIEGMTDGDLVGDWNVGESTPVPPEEVRARLEAIGNDGDFFGFDREHEFEGAYCVNCGVDEASSFANDLCYPA